MKEWERQERDVARRRGGARNAGSGSGWKRRNDVRESKILWEMKQSAGVAISVKRQDWITLRRNALMEGRMPVMHLRIGSLNLCVISEADFDEHFPSDDEVRPV